MRIFNLEYRLEEKETPEVRMLNGVPVVDESAWKRFSSGDEKGVKEDAAYQIRKGEYEELISQGFWFRIVTERELPPGVKGWYNPVTREAVGVDRETRMHETCHHEMYTRNEVTAQHESDVRRVTRNRLNYLGMNGNYHG